MAAEYRLLLVPVAEQQIQGPHPQIHSHALAHGPLSTSRYPCQVQATGATGAIGAIGADYSGLIHRHSLPAPVYSAVAR